MTQKHAASKMIYVVSFAIVLVSILLFSIIVGFGAATRTSCAQYAVFDGTSIFFKTTGLKSNISGSVKATWSSKPASTAAGFDSIHNNSKAIKLTGTSCSVPATVNTHSKASDVVTTWSDGYSGDSLSGVQSTNMVYVRFAIGYSLPAGYIQTGKTLEQHSNSAAPKMFGALQTSMKSFSSSSRTAHAQVVMNIAGFPLKALESYKYTGYGITVAHRPAKLTINYNANSGTLTSSPFKSGDYYYKIVSNAIQRSTASGGTYAGGFQTANYNATTNPYNIGTFGLQRTGYHLDDGKEWNTAAGGGGTSFDHDTDYTAQQINTSLASGDKSSTLYANWKVNTLKTTYNLNGGTFVGSTGSAAFNSSGVSTSVQSTNYGTNFNMWNIAVGTGNPVTTITAYKTGYHLDDGKEWKIGSTEYDHDTDYSTTSGTFNIGALATGSNSRYTASKSQTAYANWQPNTGTITYDKNASDATGTTQPTNYTYDSTESLSENGFERPGYVFRNWNTKPDGSGTTYSKNASIKQAFPDGSATLYAQWGNNMGTIEFDPNGGNGYMEDQEYEVGVEQNIDKNKYENEGYKFVGWNTERDGSGTTFGDEQGIKDAFVINNGDIIELFAQWEPIDYIIHYDGNRHSGGKMEDQSAEMDSVVTLRENEFTKKGFVFKNWSTDADGITYQDKSQIQINSNLLNGTDDPQTGNGNWQEGTFDSTGQIATISDSPVAGLNKAIENNGSYTISQKDVPVSPGKTYTLSCYAKGNGTLDLKYNDGTLHNETTQINTEEWKLCSFTFTPEQGTGYNENIIDVYFGNSSSGNLQITGMKLEEGNRVTQYIHKDNREITLYANWTRGKFSLEGDVSVSGYQFRTIQTENGILHLDTKLSDNKYFTIFGLDDESVYQINEAKDKNYAPSYEVTAGKEFVTKKTDSADSNTALSTPEEELFGNMEYKYTNTRDVSGKNLTVRKKVSGDLATDEDKNTMFTFSYYVTGLDPNTAYSIVKNISEEESVITQTPTTALSPGDPDYSVSGTISGEVSIKHGDYFTIENLPEGAKYNIIEKTGVSLLSDWPYKSSYEVTEGAENDNGDPLVNSVSSHGITSLPNGGNTVYGLSINQNGEHNAQGLGVETMHDQSVEYLFRNTKSDNHALTVRKQVEINGENDDESSDEFQISLNFSNLEPNTLYTASDSTYSFVSDQNGKASVNVSLMTNQQVTFYNIPGDVEYEAEEANSAYTANVEVITGDDIIYETTGMYGQGVSVNNQENRVQRISEESDDIIPDKEIGLDADQTILFTNSNHTANDIVVNKEIEGNGASDTDEFNYSIQFTGLSLEDYEVEKVTKNEDDEILSTTTSTFSPDSENATYQFTLRSNETITIKNIPNTATYKITESGSEGYTPSYTFVKGETNNSEDYAETGESLSTETEELPANAEITFTNTKGTPPPVKTVSDEDNVSWGGNATETDVAENTVPDKKSEWSYKISQKIYPGYETFEFEDELPNNVIFKTAAEKIANEDESDVDLSNDILIKWKNPDDTVLTETISKNDADDDENIYESDHFEIEADMNSVIIRSKDNVLIENGGEFEVVLKVKVNPDSDEDDFIGAGQVYKLNERLVFKNYATTTLDENKYKSNLTKTNIPLDRVLVIDKNVTGNLGDLIKEFEFTLALSGLTPNKRYTYENSAYIKVGVEQNDELEFDFKATDEKADPVQGVKIKIYSVTDEPAIDEETGEETTKGKTELFAQRTTGSDGKTSIHLDPGEYKYEYSYDGETVSGIFFVESEDDSSVVNGIEEIFMPRNDYDTEKYFLTDENGNATIKFKLKDDESISFANLPKGVKYKITEAASNHIPSYEVTRGPEDLENRSDALEVKEESLSTPEESLTESTEYKFTNHRSLESITSVKTIGILLFLILAVLVLLVIVTRKNRESQNDYSDSIF